MKLGQCNDACEEEHNDCRQACDENAPGDPDCVDQCNANSNSCYDSCLVSYDENVANNCPRWVQSQSVQTDAVRSEGTP